MTDTLRDIQEEEMEGQKLHQTKRKVRCHLILGVFMLASLLLAALLFLGSYTDRKEGSRLFHHYLKTQQGLELAPSITAAMRQFLSEINVASPTITDLSDDEQPDVLSRLQLNLKRLSGSSPQHALLPWTVVYDLEFPPTQAVPTWEERSVHKARLRAIIGREGTLRAVSLKVDTHYNLKDAASLVEKFKRLAVSFSPNSSLYFHSLLEIVRILSTRYPNYVKQGLQLPSEQKKLFFNLLTALRILEGKEYTLVTSSNLNDLFELFAYIPITDHTPIMIIIRSYYSRIDFPILLSYFSEKLTVLPPDQRAELLLILLQKRPENNDDLLKVLNGLQPLFLVELLQELKMKSEEGNSKMPGILRLSQYLLAQNSYTSVQRQALWLWYIVDIPPSLTLRLRLWDLSRNGSPRLRDTARLMLNLLPGGNRGP